MGELDAAKCISLTAFNRDDIGVATPVWVTRSGGGCAFTTLHYCAAGSSPSQESTAWAEALS